MDEHLQSAVSGRTNPHGESVDRRGSGALAIGGEVDAEAVLVNGEDPASGERTGEDADRHGA